MPTHPFPNPTNRISKDPGSRPRGLPLLPGLPPLASANPAALMLAQILSQLLESNLEGHVDETWRVLDFFLSEKIHHRFIKRSFWDVGHGCCFGWLTVFLLIMTTLVWKNRTCLNYRVVTWVKTTMGPWKSWLKFVA